MAKETKSRMRFAADDDVILLKEVVGQNPFEQVSRWKTVQENVLLATGKNFSERSVREHVVHLVKLFTKNDRTNLRKSRTEEQYNEKERLLEEIRQLAREFKKNSAKKRIICSKNKGILARDEAIRSDSVESQVNIPAGSTVAEDEAENVLQQEYIAVDDYRMSPNGSPIPSTSRDVEPIVVAATQASVADTSTLGRSILKPITRTRKGKSSLKNSSLQFLQDRQVRELGRSERELQLQERRLALEEKKLRLEEEKFKFEKEERERRLNMEIKERNHNLLISQQQQNLIKFFVEKLNKN